MPRLPPTQHARATAPFPPHPNLGPDVRMLRVPSMPEILGSTLSTKTHKATQLYGCLPKPTQAPESTKHGQPMRRTLENQVVGLRCRTATAACSTSQLTKTYSGVERLLNKSACSASMRTCVQIPCNHIKRCAWLWVSITPALGGGQRQAGRSQEHAGQPALLKR